MNAAQARVVLEAKLKETLATQEKLEAHLRNEDREVPQDWADRGTFLENDEVLEDLDEHATVRALAIRAALKRVEDGTWAICTSCGDQIPHGRLEAVPWTPFCATCAAQREG